MIFRELFGFFLKYISDNKWNLSNYGCIDLCVMLRNFLI